jgi:hypothetical protein
MDDVKHCSVGRLLVNAVRCYFLGRGCKTAVCQRFMGVLEKAACQRF